MKKRSILFFCLILLSLLIGCEGKKEPSKIVLADQFGLAYAPLQIMKEKGFLEEELPGIQVEWARFGNTVAIREAMLSGNLDVGFVGIPPFLIGLDNGMDWKILSSLSQSPAGLVSGISGVEQISDISKDKKIILPQPGSIQHILLSMYCEKELGRSDYFDQQLISMTHPDGMTALLNDSESFLHFTTPPYLFEELKDGKHKILLDGETCFGGEFSFIVGICRESFAKEENRKIGFQRALEKSILFMEENPQESLSILAKEYEYDENILEEYLSNPQMKYSTEVKGLEQFVEFMYRNELLKEQYGNEELLWN